jgi:hypothetical protein
MIPNTFNEETEFSNNSNLNSLKRHCMTFYSKVSKDFLDYIEDTMSHDSLIGSTISTRSKKSVSCASKISCPSVLSHDTKTSNVSEKANPHDFYSKNFNHAFLPNTDFEGYRNNSKKEFEENQSCIGGEKFHQEPDHSSTFVKMVIERARTMLAVNDEKRQVYLQKSFGMEPSTVLKYLETMLKVIMEDTKLVLVICLNQVSRKHIWRGVLTVMLIIWMKYLLLPRSRRMHVHCMAHYSVHARVV